MNINDIDRRVVKYLFLITGLVLLVIYFGKIVTGIAKILSAFQIVFTAIALAYVLNIVMVRIEKLLSRKVQEKHLRGLSVTISIIVVLLAVVLLVSLVLPSLVNAIQVLIRTLPSQIKEIQTSLQIIIEEHPQIGEVLSNINLNIEELMGQLNSFLSGTVQSVFNSTLSLINEAVSSLFNGFLSFVLSIYLLADKERFIRMYHRIMNLFASKRLYVRLNLVLSVFNQTFSSFFSGQVLEAIILSTLCAVGMLILRMPYAVMIGILVGFINIIPMVGAYVGGAIGMFLVYSVNPLQSVVFLIYLIILQQFESNVIYPRVVGRSIGLPGIFVLISVLVFGALSGVMGMLLGIPFVASVYKLVKIFVEKKELEKDGLIQNQ